MEFKEFPKIPRLSRPIVITEKIDGTNGCIYIGENGEFLIGSRTRWITPENDNHGFARWAYQHKDELINGLGHGLHYGEWWGSGIQRGYGLTKGEKRFSLFNTHRWGDNNDATVRPECCSVVPILTEAPFFHSAIVSIALNFLAQHGSQAAPGIMNPEGIIIYHAAANMMFKKTIKGDDGGKGNNGYNEFSNSR